jgi:hypothetical protein
MAGDKQDSNFVGLLVAREVSSGVLPNNAVFREREPNSFDDLGGEYTLLARRPFNASRQRKKGGVVDLDADGGWNEDFTQRGMDDTMEAFFFAAMRRKPQTVATMATAATDDFTVADSAGFIEGALVQARGFRRNRRLHLVNAVPDATHVSVTTPLTDEPVVSGGVIEVVGHQFDAGDLSLELDGPVVHLISATMDFTTFGFIPGEWVFVGGDEDAMHFADLPGFYARIAVGGVLDDRLTFDKTTRTPIDSDGAGKTVQLFFGYLVKNEDDPELIVKFTHTVERTLGKDADGTQSEYLGGFVLNEMTWNSPLADKVNIDVTGVAMSHGKRKGADGPLSKLNAGGNVSQIIRAEGDEMFNTSSNVFRLRLSIIDPETLNPTPLFARVTEWSASINNNVSVNKSQGTLGGFDTTAGTFDFDGEFTAYFTTVAAAEAIEENRDVTFDAIYSKDNGAVIMDVPLIALGGGRLTVEMDEPIMLPLTMMGAESPFGYTALLNWLPYVPNVGIANGR